MGTARSSSPWTSNARWYAIVAAPRAAGAMTSDNFFTPKFWTVSCVPEGQLVSAKAAVSRSATAWPNRITGSRGDGLLAIAAASSTLSEDRYRAALRSFDTLSELVTPQR
jgi:hypothetical protein